MENKIKCPHCGYIHENFWDFIECDDCDGEFPMNCEECNKNFNVNFTTTINFKTSI